MKKDKFIQGFACAIACVIKTYDMASVGIGILRENGFDLKDLKEAGIDGNDYKIIKKVVDNGERL